MLEQTNYFNLIDDLSNLKATDGITSSSGKAVKFGISKIVGYEDTVYMFLLAHQDDTDVEAGEIFTFNLTPDKNSTLDPIYSPVANVQQAIEIIVNDKIPDIYDYSGAETLTNKIAIVNGERKQVYRKIITINYTTIRDGLGHHASFSYSNYGLSNCYVTKAEISFKRNMDYKLITLSIFDGYIYFEYSNNNKQFDIDYNIPSSFLQNIEQLILECEYYKN